MFMGVLMLLHKARYCWIWRHSAGEELPVPSDLPPLSRRTGVSQEAPRQGSPAAPAKFEAELFTAKPTRCLFHKSYASIFWRRQGVKSGALSCPVELLCLVKRSGPCPFLMPPT